jgi:preprotein translocase subunit SecE
MAIERTDNVEQNTGLRAPLGWWGRASDFIAEVRNEMKRVTWPSRREVYATTLVVIITSAFFGVYLFGVDIALNRVVRFIFDRFGAA